jgi:hypothetical protein
MVDRMGNSSISALVAEMMLHIDPNKTYLNLSPEEQVTYNLNVIFISLSPCSYF